MDYEPARSSHAIELGRTDSPITVLRSHPDFPNTLCEELEGTLTNSNPAWPDETINLLLLSFQPPCHTDWHDFDPEETEAHDGFTAYIIYVRPGSRPVPAAAG